MSRSMTINQTKDGDSATWSRATGEHIIFSPEAGDQYEELYITCRAGSPKFFCVDRKDLGYDFNNLTGPNPDAPKYMISLAKRALLDITVAHSIHSLLRGPKS